jgi:hypothetical protein
MMFCPGGIGVAVAPSVDIGRKQDTGLRTKNGENLTV